MSDLLEPKEIQFDLPNGKKKTYILSKFPSVQGREIMCQYTLTGIPKLGSYAQNEEIMFKLMSYVALKQEGGQLLRLVTEELINNHTAGWDHLMRLEWAMIEYNGSFFLNERISGFFSALAAMLPKKISEILTDSLEALSHREKPPSTNSEPSTL